jgi:DNA-directed RNA polymerase I subunit RPA43
MHNLLLTSTPWTAHAVSRIDNLEFLADVVPPMHTLKPARETKLAKSKRKAIGEIGQTTLSGHILAKANRDPKDPDRRADAEAPDTESPTKDTDSVNEVNSDEDMMVE